MTGIFFIIILALTAILTPPALKAQEATINIDPSKIENRITPWLYGSCIEDVNHEIYGGLWDQKIFGESFEEPVHGFQFANFTSYGGNWQPEGEMVSVGSCAGGKLVSNEGDMAEGSARVELKFDKPGSGNAGLLIRVTQPGNGADRFNGYEISLMADGSRIVLGKHVQNYRMLEEIPVNCKTGEWNLLMARMTGNHLEVILNGKTVLRHDDAESPLLTGSIALRTWHSDVRFRNPAVEAGTRKKVLSFTGQPGPAVSNQWDTLCSPGTIAEFRRDDLDALNGSFSQFIRMKSVTGMAGITNKGLNGWGIAIGKGKVYRGRLWLKGRQMGGSVFVALQSTDGRQNYALQEIKTITGQWEKYEYTLSPDTSDPMARFSVYIRQTGEIWVDQVNLSDTGNDLFHGLPFRNDIGQAMVNQGLTFLRYGGSMVNAPGYRFKKMTGDPDRRPPYNGTWYPYSTNGFGIEEFLKFCEAAKLEAAFAVNVEETPEDVADMTEYLNGPATSTWGKKRAENGHPEPYGVKFIEIGNEEVINADDPDGYRHYIERFNLLHDAIRSKDTSVNLINASWWRPGSPNMELVFRALNGKAAFWDYHPWADGFNSGENVEKDLKNMQDLFLLWDPQTTMKCAIFEENGGLHNLQRALGHVTIQNAVRRHGEFVLTSCAANALQPWLQNDNGWDQGQVFFTPSLVWGMPPYYAQRMASANHQPLRISCRVTGQLDVTATRDEKGQVVVVHIANTTGQPVSSIINIPGSENFNAIRSICLSGNPWDRNTPDQPEKIIPVEKELPKTPVLNYLFPAYSYTILKYVK